MVSLPFGFVFTTSQTAVAAPFVTGISAMGTPDALSVAATALNAPPSLEVNCANDVVAVPLITAGGVTGDETLFTFATDTNRCTPAGTLLNCAFSLVPKSAWPAIPPPAANIKPDSDW